MNIIPELINMDELDLEEVNTIYSLNEYYNQHCFNNVFIREKLKEAKLAAANKTKDSLGYYFVLKCEQIRRVDYYVNLLTILNIPNNYCPKYKDYFIYSIKKDKNYSFVLLGKPNNPLFHINPIMIINPTYKKFQLFLTYLYYNQIL